MPSPWMANSQQPPATYNELENAPPQVQKRDQGRNQHCSTFHWPKRRVMHFNVGFFVSVNICLCNSTILIKTLCTTRPLQDYYFIIIVYLLLNSSLVVLNSLIITWNSYLYNYYMKHHQVRQVIGRSKQN